MTGSIQLDGNFDFGSPNYPALARLYIGTNTTWRVTGDILSGGNVYAANATFTAQAPIEIYGALYINNFSNSATTKIHYDLSTLKKGADCGTPPPPMCTTCVDCGNQACNAGKCGTCVSNSDCCASLYCVNGVCEALIP